MIDIFKELSKIESKAKRKGIPIAHLCKKAGVGESTWQEWRHRKYTPKLSTVQRLIDALR